MIWLFPPTYDHVISDIRKSVMVNHNTYRVKDIKYVIQSDRYITLVEVQNAEYTIKIDTDKYHFFTETFYPRDSDVIIKQRITRIGSDSVYIINYDRDHLPHDYGNASFDTITHMIDDIHKLFFKLNFNYRLPYYNLEIHKLGDIDNIIQTKSDHILYHHPIHNTTVKFDLDGRPMFGINMDIKSLFIHNNKFSILYGEDIIIFNKQSNIMMKLNQDGVLIEYNDDNVTYNIFKYKRNHIDYDCFVWQIYTTPNMTYSSKNHYYRGLIKPNGWSVSTNNKVLTNVCLKKNDVKIGNGYYTTDQNKNYVIADYDNNLYMLYDKDGVILMSYQKLDKYHVFQKYENGIIHVSWTFNVNEILDVKYYDKKKPKYKIQTIIDILHRYMKIAIH
jgi:hypothetical protein